MDCFSSLFHIFDNFIKSPHLLWNTVLILTLPFLLHLLRCTLTEKVGLHLNNHYTGSKVELIEKFTSDSNKNLRCLNKKHLVGNRFYYTKSYICNSFKDHPFQFPVHCICNCKYFLFDYSVSPREGRKQVCRAYGPLTIHNVCIKPHCLLYYICECPLNSTRIAVQLTIPFGIKCTPLREQTSTY